MNSWTRLTLAALIAGGLLSPVGCSGRSEARPQEVKAPVAATLAAAVPGQALPRLIDLGAGACIPCKAMAPILEQLRTDYAGRMQVQFIDVWKAPEAAQPYSIRVIPTQIFFAADGRELARHEGFMGREEILAQWKALGISL